MPRKKSYLTGCDFFCGLGGNSDGAKASGVEMLYGSNHWKLATDTYNANNQNAQVDCADIQLADPRRCPSTDIAYFSPTCTTHTPSGGNHHKALKAQMNLFEKQIIDPKTERSRATMWEVPRYTEYHNYECIIVENVVEAKTRWPLFDNWLGCMHTLGYNHKCVYLNSMHCHPTPQSRDRMYVIFWKKGNHAPDLDYFPPAYCPKCSKDVASVQTWKNPLKKFGKYRQQYVYCCPVDGTIVEPYYYAAYNVIDWSNLGTRIGDKKKPQSPVTKKRVLYGLEKYKDEPFFMHAAYSDNARGVVRPMIKPLFTQTTLQSQALVVPFIIKGEQTSQLNMVRSVNETFQTQQTRQTFSLVTPESFRAFLSAYNTNGHSLKYFTEEAGTITTTERLALTTYSTPNYEDCYYRMLNEHEAKLGMGFSEDYIVLGKPKEQFVLCGNAVTPPAMKMITKRVVQSLN